MGFSTSFTPSTACPPTTAKSNMEHKAGADPEHKTPKVKNKGVGTKVILLGGKNMWKRLKLMLELNLKDDV